MQPYREFKLPYREFKLPYRYGSESESGLTEKIGSGFNYSGSDTLLSMTMILSTEEQVKSSVADPKFRLPYREFKLLYREFKVLTVAQIRIRKK